MAAPKASPIGNLKEVARAAVARVHVCLPATVLSYDESTQTATVQIVPCFRRKDPTQRNEVVCYRPPPIPGVPVAFPGAGGFSITWPLAAGDSGLLMVADRSIDEWKATGAATTEPQDERRHNLSDSVFVPGVRSPAAPLESPAVDANAMVVTAPRVVVDCDDIRLGSASASAAVALATLTDQQLAELKTTLTSWVVVAGDGGAALKAALTTLFATGWPATTAASKVVAE